MSPGDPVLLTHGLAETVIAQSGKCDIWYLYRPTPAKLDFGGCCFICRYVKAVVHCELGDDLAMRAPWPRVPEICAVEPLWSR